MCKGYEKKKGERHKTYKIVREEGQSYKGFGLKIGMRYITLYINNKSISYTLLRTYLYKDLPSDTNIGR